MSNIDGVSLINISNLEIKTQNQTATSGITDFAGVLEQNGVAVATTATVGAYVLKAGDSMSGALDMKNNQVQNVNKITANATNYIFSNSGTAGTNVVAIGSNALNVNTAVQDVAIGSSAMAANTTGISDVAVGYLALQANTTGSSNTAIGHSAMRLNVTGNNNTAVGAQALENNTLDRNSAFGTQAMANHTSGINNCAFGYNALSVNTTSSNNNAFGQRALNNSNGGSNNAFGVTALNNVTSGSQNLGFGNSTLTSIVTGSHNIAIGNGSSPASDIGNTVALGNNALCNAAGAIVISNGGGTSVTNSTANSILLGNTLDNIRPNVNNACDLGTASKQFKDIYFSGSLIGTYVSNLFLADGSVSMTGNLNMNTHAITNVGEILTDSSNVVIGQNPIYGGFENVVIGKDMNLAGTVNDSGAIGKGNTITVDGCFVYGRDNTCDADTVIFGYGNTSTGNTNIVIGNANTATGSDISIIGSGLTNTVDATVLFGNLSNIRPNNDSTCDLGTSANKFNSAYLNSVRLPQAANSTSGVGAVLVGGTVTVNTTAVSTGDIVLLSRTTNAGVSGHAAITAIVNATSFTITSSSVADTSTFSWVIIKQA